MLTYKIDRPKIIFSFVISFPQRLMQVDEITSGFFIYVIGKCCVTNRVLYFREMMYKRLQAVFGYLTLSFQYCSFYCTLFITLNRVAVVLFPMKAIFNNNKLLYRSIIIFAWVFSFTSSITFLLRKSLHKTFHRLFLHCLTLII